MSKPNISPAPPLLEDLRQRFAQNLTIMKDRLREELSSPEASIYNDEIWMIRFMLNPRYSIDEVIERYRKMIRNRQDDGIPAIHAALIAQGDNMDIKTFPHFEVINRAFPESLFHTRDIHGQPVALQVLGHSEPKSVKVITKEQFYEYAKHKAEYMRIILDKLSLESGKLLQWIQVIDLHDLGLKHASTDAMDYVRTASNRIDQMYKECLGRIYITNAPRIFHAIWEMAKLWLNERTVEKASLMGKAYKEELVTFIPAESWPVFMGGKQHVTHIGFFELKHY